MCITRSMVEKVLSCSDFAFGFQVDWFEDELTEIHKKVRTKECIENKAMIEEAVEMMRSHRDKKFKDELAKMKENAGIVVEKD